MNRQKHTILIADDEPSSIETIFETLKNSYNIVVAANGKMCVEIALAVKPALIITDWDMPVMTGIDAVREIKRHDSLRNTLIIMATGKMTRIENLQTALSAGAVDFVRKPFDLPEIEARVGSMIMLYEKHLKNIELEKQNSEQKLQLVSLELEQSKKALAGATLRLIQNSNLNMQLIDDLNIVAKQSSESEIKIIKKIIDRHNSKLTECVWNEFEVLFEQVHKSFYANLNAQFPEITPGERRLCAFMKLNMSNKEISAITNQTDDSLKKARHRLRKKFGIEQEVNLINFIQNI